ARLLEESYSEFTPHTVTVVTPPWNFPIAIPTGGIAASLAAGSAVIVKPAPQVVHCGKLVVEAFRTALEAQGLDPDLVQLVLTDEAAAGKA
ncbi:aldehyde dehydrogenase family protein, partial [Rhizobium leguminosarum]